MRIFVSAKPKARKPEIYRIDETHFVVAVKASAREGKANEAIAKALARHFHIPFARLTLRSGVRSKRKVFEI